MKLQGCQAPIATSPTSVIWVLSTPDSTSELAFGEPKSFEGVQLHRIERGQIQRSQSELWWSGYDVAILSHPEHLVHLDW